MRKSDEEIWLNNKDCVRWWGVGMPRWGIPYVPYWARVRKELPICFSHLCEELHMPGSGLEQNFPQTGSGPAGHIVTVTKSISSKIIFQDVLTVHVWFTF